jgi:hypothetical protein
MRWLLIALASTSLAAPAALAESTHRTSIPEWNLTLVQRDSAPAGSDAFHVIFQLVSAKGDVVAESPPLYGPVLVSRPNRELFSCEGNGVDQGAEALIFDLAGNISGRIKHVGFLRQCGVSDDGRIYWLHYNVVKNGVPYNLVLLVGSGGTVLLTQHLDGGGVVTLERQGQIYTFRIPDPELPG